MPPSWIPPALLARPVPSGRGFRGIGLGALCGGLAKVFGAGPSFSKAAGPTVEPASVSEQRSQRRSIDRLIPDNFKLCDQRTATFKQEIEIFESVK
jgi:hypothetical protein